MLRWPLTLGVDFTTSPASLFGFLNTADDGNLMAAAFDEDKNVLFYVKYGAQPNALLFDGNGVQRGTLATYQSSTRVNPTTFNPYVYPEWGREMAVVPVPGVCKQFYLFYVQSSVIPSLACCPSFSVLLRATIDCSGATPTILTPPTPVDEYLTEPYYGIAVSKEVNGARRLYFVGTRGINSYPITSSGVGTVTRYALTNGAMQPLEADLSPDGTMLVMTASKSNSASGGIFLADVDPVSGAVSNVRAAGNSGLITFGVEFSPDSKKVYYSGKPTAGVGGIYELTIATNNTQYLSNPVSNACFNSQLELAYDGLIYAADNQDRLVTINPTTNVVAIAPAAGVVRPVPAYCNSISSNRSANPTRALPDQIDGQDYTFFFGLPASQVNNLFVSGKLIGSTFRNLYTCLGPLPLTAALTNATEVRVVVRQLDALGAVVAGGYQNQTSWLPPATTFDLVTLFGGYLGNTPDFYQITFEAHNSCGNVSRRIGLVRMNNTISSAAFVFITGIEGPTLTPSQDPKNPSGLGGIGGAVQLTGVLGQGSQGFDSFNATIQEYNNGTLTPVCAVGPVAVTAGTTMIGLNYIVETALGIPDYFKQPGLLKHVFLITLSLTNGCGTSTTVSGYFSPISDSYKVAPTTTAPGTIGLGVTGFRVYPNPADGWVHVEYILPTSQGVQIRVLDARTGQEQLRPLPRTWQAAGPHTMDVNLTSLPAGEYLYQVEAEQLVSKRFTKSE